MINIETVEVNGFSMDFFRFGRGKRIFVMIPGLSVQSVMSSADAVAGAFESLHDEFEFFVFDRRKELPEKYSVYDMAKDTVAVIEKLGLKDLYLFGASQGGMIALTIAIEHPELVKKLALGSTSSHVKEEQYEAIDNWIELAKKGDSTGLYLSFGEKVYPPAVFEQFRQYFTDVSKTVTEDELKRFVILATGLKGFNVTDRLGEIQCPVLTTGSFEDMVLDSDATMEIAENLDYRKDFRLYMYTGFGHAAYDTAPDYRQRVSEFFLQEDE